MKDFCLITYTKEELSKAVQQSSCFMDVCRYFGKNTLGVRGYLRRKIRHFGIDTGHFIGRTPRKYTREVVAKAVKNSKSATDVVRVLGGRSTTGSTITTIWKYIKLYNIDAGHFTRPGDYFKARHTRRTASEILVLSPPNVAKEKSYILRRALLEIGMEYKCSNLGCIVVDLWNSVSITLEIDHINGNNVDNRRENLRFLCPNCHSQASTSTHGKKRCQVV